MSRYRSIAIVVLFLAATDTQAQSEESPQIDTIVVIGTPTKFEPIATKFSISPRYSTAPDPGLPSSDIPEDPFMFEEIVVVATRTNRSPFDVTPAVTLISAGASRPASGTVPDMMKRAPGVSVQQTTPGQGAPIIRGLIGSATLMLVDGMRLNSSIFRPAPNQYFALVDPENVERIEILRGSGSTLYGSDAMGGVVMIRTPAPRFDGPQWRHTGRIRQSFSTADRSFLSRAEYSGGRSGRGARVGVSWSDHDNLRSGAGAQAPSGYSTIAGNATALFADDDDEMILDVQYLRQPKTPRYDELVPGCRNVTRSRFADWKRPFQGAFRMSGLVSEISSGSTAMRNSRSSLPRARLRHRRRGHQCLHVDRTHILI